MRLSECKARMGGNESVMKLSAKMLNVLSQLQLGRTTMFGSTEGTNKDCGGANYLPANTVQALIRRGLLEPCGEIPHTGHGQYYYRISEAGRQALLDDGQSIQIEVESFQVDPWLVQKAIDLQQQERFEQWRQQQ